MASADVISLRDDWHWRRRCRLESTQTVAFATVLAGPCDMVGAPLSSPGADGLGKQRILGRGSGARRRRDVFVRRHHRAPVAASRRLPISAVALVRAGAA